jgi:hypothetical protein
MNFTDHCKAIHKQANQMRSASWSLFFGAIAAYLIGTFGGSPWWVYVLLFTPSLFGFAQVLADDPATQKVLDGHSVELADSDVDNARWRGRGVGYPKTDRHASLLTVNRPR